MQEGRKQLGPGAREAILSLSSALIVDSVPSCTAESWGLSLNPRAPIVATAGEGGKVNVLSASTDDFGEELATMDATGTFGSAIRYVRHPLHSLGLLQS